MPEDNTIHKIATGEIMQLEEESIYCFEQKRIDSKLLIFYSAPNADGKTAFKLFNPAT